MIKIGCSKKVRGIVTSILLAGLGSAYNKTRNRIHYHQQPIDGGVDTSSACCQNPFKNEYPVALLSRILSKLAGLH